MTHTPTFLFPNWRRQSTGTAIVFRPTTRVVLLSIGLALMPCLCAAGLMGLDHELRRIREAGRFSPQEIAAAKANYDHQLSVERAARGPAAEQALREQLYGFVDERAAERERRYVAATASQQKWHVLIRAGAVAMAAWGLLFPISCFWQRVRIEREGNEIVVRQRRMFGGQREARVDRSAVANPEIRLVEIRVWTRYGPVSDGHRLLMHLSDGQQGFVLAPQQVVNRSDADPRPLIDALRAL